MNPGDTLYHDDSDGDNVQLFWTCRRRRRSATHCEASCGAPIEPGDVYLDGRFVGPLGWDRFALHLGCWEEGQRQADDYQDRIEYSSVAEGAREDGREFDPVTKEWKPCE